MKAMELGVELPPEPVEAVKQPLKAIDYLRRGLLCLAVGIGLWVGQIFTRGLEEVGGFIGVGGIIIFLVGIALLIYYAVQKKTEQ